MAAAVRVDYKASPFVKLPLELQLEITKPLSVKDLISLKATCKQLHLAVWERLAQISINQLSKYATGTCDWCKKAIVVIQTSYHPAGVDPHKIAQLVFGLGASPSHHDFSRILQALDCEKKIEPHHLSPLRWTATPMCLCEVD